MQNHPNLQFSVVLLAAAIAMCPGCVIPFVGDAKVTIEVVDKTTGNPIEKFILVETEYRSPYASQYIFPAHPDRVHSKKRPTYVHLREFQSGMLLHQKARYSVGFPILLCYHYQKVGFDYYVYKDGYVPGWYAAPFSASLKEPIRIELEPLEPTDRSNDTFASFGAKHTSSVWRQGIVPERELQLFRDVALIDQKNLSDLIESPRPKQWGGDMQDYESHRYYRDETSWIVGKKMNRKDLAELNKVLAEVDSQINVAKQTAK